MCKLWWGPTLCSMLCSTGEEVHRTQTVPLHSFKLHFPSVQQNTEHRKSTKQEWKQKQARSSGHKNYSLLGDFVMKYLIESFPRKSNSTTYSWPSSSGADWCAPPGEQQPTVSMFLLPPSRCLLARASCPGRRLRGWGGGCGEDSTNEELQYHTVSRKPKSEASQVSLGPGHQSARLWEFWICTVASWSNTVWRENQGLLTFPKSMSLLCPLKWEWRKEDI